MHSLVLSELIITATQLLTSTILWTFLYIKISHLKKTDSALVGNIK